MSENLDLKLLKKLADACRKAGISSFKGHGIEFTLGDAPQPKVAKSTPKTNHDDGKDPVSDDPSPEELLFWSAGGTTLASLGLVPEDTNEN